MGLVSRLALIGLGTLGLGCSPEPTRPFWNLHAPKPGDLLPRLPSGSPAQQRDFLIQEAATRADKALDADSLIWRRLAQIQRKRGKTAEARAFLRKAAEKTEDPITRSLIADELLSLGDLKGAQEALGHLGYLGFRPELLRFRAGALPTDAERARLAAPSTTGRGPGSTLQVFPTRLVIQLVVRGAKDAVETQMRDRLMFALQRGPQGGRDTSYHDAILCWFYLGHYQEALQATERETLFWRVQTLGCLLAGGATDPDSVLFPDTRLPERDNDPRILAGVPESVRAEIRHRLLKALNQIPIRTGEPLPMLTERLEETYLARIVMLAALLGHWDIAQVGAARVSDPEYRAQFATAFAQRTPPLFTPIHPTRAMGAVGSISQNLARIGRFSEPVQGKRLLNQVLQEGKKHRCLSLLADSFSQVAWYQKSPELIPELIQGFPMGWFQTAQSLKLAVHARQQGDTVLATHQLQAALNFASHLVKPNQKLLLSLDIAEEARQQGDTATCDRLRHEMEALLPHIITETVRTEGTLRLVRLHRLRQDQAAYTPLMESAQQRIVAAGTTFPAESDRLRVELSGMLVEAGDFPDAYTVLQPLHTTVLQPHALCNLMELELGLTLPPRSYLDVTAPLGPIPPASR